VLERSIELADRYLNGPEKGVVLLLLPHSVELFLLHIGAILRGKIPAILAWPTSRVDPDKYQRNLLHQLRNLPAAQLVTLPGLARNLEAGLQYRISACPIARAEYWEKTFDRELVVEPAEKDVRTQAANDLQEDALFLQFSGGTTGAQKCVVVRVGMLETQLRLLSESLDFGPRDAVVSWLPMYHDMGLIACLWLPLWSGAPSVQISAQDWLMDPGLLLRFMDRFRGTYCWLPNFAFSYLAGQYGRMKGACSLGHVRGWINCSEPVRLRSMKAFTDAFSGWGVRPAQCQVSYAMAENVFAVTQTRLGGIPVMVSRSQLDRSMNLPELAYDMLDDIYVSSGRTLAGMQLRIRRADGSLGGENQQGGIEIQTECMFDGYWGNDGFQRQALTSDGWYVTGDSGFISGQELFVIGRTKDIVIVGGQNIFPEDVEMVANTVVGVYPGRVVAFGVEDVQQGTENLVVVSEMRGEFDAGKAQQIERDIHRQVLAAVGVAPRHVRVVPERWIVKSTAGKISRRETRLRFLEETATLAVGKPTK
jgi:acyl-CoA synthetase (AMP-forming)/AMP-acid ligase II